MAHRDRFRPELACLLTQYRTDRGSLLPLKDHMATIVFHHILLQFARARWLAPWST